LVFKKKTIVAERTYTTKITFIKYLNSKEKPVSFLFFAFQAHALPLSYTSGVAPILLFLFTTSHKNFRFFNVLSSQQMQSAFIST
jgi:predicted NAD/FAD-binding protein